MSTNKLVLGIWGAIALLTVFLIWVVPSEGSKFGLGMGTQVENEVIGTTGRSAIAPDESTNDQTVRALEQMTGVKKEADLIGKRISVKATPEQVSGTSFWADAGRNAQVLVVMSRDRRDQKERYLSEVAPTDLATTPNQQVEVSGTIQRVPGPGGRFTWGLDDGTHGPLRARVYLKVDRETTAAPSPRP